jgi:hypothetical protein
MPLTTTEKAALAATAATLASQVDALVVDTVDVSELQAALASMTSERDAALSQVVLMQDKIANAKAAIQAATAADATEDAARAQALQALE